MTEKELLKHLEMLRVSHEAVHEFNAWDDQRHEMIIALIEGKFDSCYILDEKKK